jgi:hypothetical protein
MLKTPISAILCPFRRNKCRFFVKSNVLWWCCMAQHSSGQVYFMDQFWQYFVAELNYKFRDFCAIKYKYWIHYSPTNVFVFMGRVPTNYFTQI